GIIPGIILGIALMVTSYITAKKQGYEGTGEIPSFKDVLKAVNEAKLALLIPIIILGGIYGGFFSPTESAAVASIYALLIGVFVYRVLDWKSVYDSFSSAVLIIAYTVFFISFCMSFVFFMIRYLISYIITIFIFYIIYIISFYIIFAFIIIRELIPVIIADFIVNISSCLLVIILFINLFLLIVGMFIDTISAIVILTPILLPVVTSLGVDPVHFGVILVMNLAIGFVTPPLGVNLFVASTVGKVQFEKIVKAMVPILVAMLVALLIVIYFPPLSS